MSNRNRNDRNPSQSRQHGRDQFEQRRSGSRDWEGSNDDQREYGPQGRGYAMPDYGGPRRDEYSQGYRFADQPSGGYRRGGYGLDYEGGHRSPDYRSGEGRLRSDYDQSGYPGGGYGGERGVGGGRYDDNWETGRRQRWHGSYGEGSATWDAMNESGYGKSYRAYGPYDPYGGGGEQESWGDQLRDAGHWVVRRVKRAFRGPKGYKRSDDRIREDVCDRLAEQSEFDPSEIEVSLANGEVTLTGSVQSRQEKFRAEEITDDVSGVTEVHNHLRVRREAATEPGGGNVTAPQSEQRSRNARA